MEEEEKEEEEEEYTEEIIKLFNLLKDKYNDEDDNNNEYEEMKLLSFIEDEEILRYYSQKNDSLLMIALQLEHYELAKEIISRGLLIDEADTLASGETPFLTLCRRKKYDLIEMLVEKNCNLDSVDSNLGWTALHNTSKTKYEIVTNTTTGYIYLQYLYVYLYYIY